MRRLFLALMELAYPSRTRCAGCGDRRGVFDFPFCSACRASLHRDHHGFHPGDWPEAGVSRAYAAYRYIPVIRGAIHACKFSRVRKVGAWLGGELGALHTAMGSPRADIIVPVPLSARRRRERGFNQAEILAMGLARTARIPVKNALERVRDTARQARLPHGKRFFNVSGAFYAKIPLEGLTVLLVDDVVTSGETCNECAKALRRAGAADVFLFAVADATHPANE